MLSLVMVNLLDEGMGEGDMYDDENDSSNLP